mmetsp:Transcript_14824/g.31105  ORF Transcript_14824/g.31105 Transcript_14824/m.31105 type:complete len:215 (-) Transcript_14824:21-665(-)
MADPRVFFSKAGLRLLDSFRSRPNLKAIPLPSGKASVASKNFLLSGADCEAGRKISYRLFYDAGAKKLQGVCHFGEMAEGPPGMVHGGAASAMLDTVMGNLCWWSGEKVVTGRLSVDYRNMLPLNTTCSVNAWFDKEEGRKLHVRAHLASIQGGAEDGAAVSEAAAAAAAATEDLHVYSESQAIFIKLSDKSMDILAANREKNRGAVLPMYSRL